MADAALRQICDFCQSEFDWTNEQRLLDIQLRLLGSALGQSCPACDDTMAQLEIDREARRAS